MNDRNLEIYDLLKQIQDHMNEYYAQALTQGKENELEIVIDNVRQSIKSFIILRDSLYRRWEVVDETAG